MPALAISPVNNLRLAQNIQCVASSAASLGYTPPSMSVAHTLIGSRCGRNSHQQNADRNQRDSDPAQRRNILGEQYRRSNNDADKLKGRKGLGKAQGK